VNKKDISDKEIDENVYEFVVPEVDPVTRNRVLGPGPKTQFDTPPTAFRQKSRKDAMGPDGIGEDVVKFVNKNSDVLQNPRDGEAPTGYNPYQSTAYGYNQKKADSSSDGKFLSHEGYLHAQSVTDAAIPWSEDRVDSMPAMNGSGKHGWGDGLIKKKENPGGSETLHLYQRSRKNIGTNNVDPDVYDAVHPNIDPVQAGRTENPPKPSFIMDNTFIQKNDISTSGVGDNVHDTVAENVSEIPEPRTASAAQKDKKDCMSPDGAGEDVVRFVNDHSDYLQNPRTDDVPTHGNYNSIGSFSQK